MEETPKIELYKVRDFSERINTMFLFIKQNRKALIRTVLCLVPFYIILAVSQSLYVSSLYFNFYSAFSYRFATLCLVVTNSIFSLVASMFAIAYVIEYEASENTEVSISKVWTRVKDSFWGGLLGSLIMAVTFSLGIMMCIIPGIWVVTSLSLFLAAYMLDREKEVRGSVMHYMSESIRLVGKDWFGAFGFIFVIAAIMGAFVILMTLPALAINMFAETLHNDQYLVIASNILSIFTGHFCRLILSVLAGVTTSFLLFDFKEREEGLSIHKKIDSIGRN